MMRVTDRDRQSVGGIRARLRAGQENGNHRGHLPLLRRARADDRLLHQTRGVFGNAQARPRGGQDRRGARLPQLQGRPRIRADELVFHRRFMRAVLCHQRLYRREDRFEALWQRRLHRRADRAVGDERQARAGLVDHAPARGGKARINAKNANRLAHRLSIAARTGHGTDERRTYPLLALKNALRSAALSSASTPPVTSGRQWQVG